jgi:hypothetical protein
MCVRGVLLCLTHEHVTEKGILCNVVRRVADIQQGAGAARR